MSDDDDETNETEEAVGQHAESSKSRDDDVGSSSASEMMLSQALRQRAVMTLVQILIQREVHTAALTETALSPCPGRGRRGPLKTKIVGVDSYVFA